MSKVEVNEQYLQAIHNGTITNVPQWLKDKVAGYYALPESQRDKSVFTRHP